MFWILLFLVSFSGIVPTSSNESVRYFRNQGYLLELFPKGEVTITQSDITFVNGHEEKKVSREEMLKLFPDSTATADRIFKNDSLIKHNIYVPVSRNYWYKCQVETVISGQSGRSTTSSTSGDVSYLFDRHSKAKRAGLVKLKGTNIYFIMPYN